MDTAANSQRESDNEFRRGRLAALGRAVRETTGLRAVVQLPSEANVWMLYVCESFAGDAPSAYVACTKVEETWWFVWPTGRLIGPADDVMGAAQKVAEGPRNSPRTSRNRDAVAG
ncbi:hypothetical protein [Actinomadura rupiterrae]|uniref:hypothetical protein n=1 Tax=Actinomadura rupiterrae TaxID=559627 RepID=UPI0020A46EBF|nr:hypothetical protein [Actinomadura rupiterrae]MCP2335789.1 hypothetical protein [Actinomadura rupiterrae]